MCSFAQCSSTLQQSISAAEPSAIGPQSVGEALGDALGETLGDALGDAVGAMVGGGGASGNV